jgi:hypothetical protein
LLFGQQHLGLWHVLVKLEVHVEEFKRVFDDEKVVLVSLWRIV